MNHCFNNNINKNINLCKLRMYMSYNITLYFNKQYNDNPDIESIDISSSIVSRRYDIENFQNCIDECFKILSTKNYIHGIVNDFISINIVPFEGLMINGDSIFSVVETYIY